jgi:alkylhydroperoxidase family enzyme
MQQGVTEELYSNLDAEYRDDPYYSDAEKVAIEYTERFALDHLAIDDELFARLLQHYDAGDVLDLSVTIARHLGFGRITQVLGLDVLCPIHPEADPAAAPP